jgi:hypothetical protein
MTLTTDDNLPCINSATKTSIIEEIHELYDTYGFKLTKETGNKERKVYKKKKVISPFITTKRPDTIHSTQPLSAVLFLT